MKGFLITATMLASAAMTLAVLLTQPRGIELPPPRVVVIR